MANKKTIFNTFLIFVFGLALFYSYQSNRHPKKHLTIQIESINNIRQLNQLPKKYSLIYFGFLSCPDFCPTTLGKLSSVLKNLNTDDLAKIQTLFITVDPERDLLEKMTDYTTFFHKDIIPIRTSLDNLKIITNAYDIHFKKVKLDNSFLEYTIDHSTEIIVTNPDLETISVINHDSNASEITTKILNLINQRE